VNGVKQRRQAADDVAVEALCVDLHERDLRDQLRVVLLHKPSHVDRLHPDLVLAGVDLA
jgi:hypothetical protein